MQERFCNSVDFPIVGNQSATNSTNTGDSSKMKPIFYYIENDVIRAICDRYGSQLERLTSAQKLELIGYLGIWMAEVIASEDNENIEWRHRQIESNPDDDVRAILESCDALYIDDVVRLISAIAGVTKV